MILLYILLSYLLFELLNWKKLNKYNAVFSTMFGLVLILSILFEKINFLRLEMIEKNEIYLLVIPSLLVINIFEFKFNKNYIILKRMIFLSIMVVASQIEILLIAFSVLGLSLEIFMRTKKSKYLIETSLTWLIPVLIILPFLSKIEGMLFYYEYLLLCIVMLILLINISKISVFRVLSALILSGLLINTYQNSIVTGIIGAFLFCLVIVYQLYDNGLIKKRAIKYKYLDKIMNKAYLLIEKKEKKAIERSPEKSVHILTNNNFLLINYHNDLISTFVFLIATVGLIGLWVIFRN